MRKGTKNVQERLDKALGIANGCMPSLTIVLHLPRSRSDHYPLLVQLGGSKNNLKMPVSFKVLEPGFNIPNLRNFGNCWSNSTVLDVALKLQSLSKSPLQWNRCVFWNIFYRKFHCLARLAGAQKALQSWPSNRLELLEEKLRAELDLILAQSVHDHQEMEKSYSGVETC